MTQFFIARDNKPRMRFVAMIALALAGVGIGVSDAAGGGAPAAVIGVTAAHANNFKVIRLAVPRIYRRAGLDAQGNQAYLSAPVTFTLPSNTVSFQLYMRGGDAEAACLNQVLDPDNIDVLTLGRTSILDFGADYCSALIPQGPQFVAKPGRWQYQLEAFGRAPNDISVTLAVRTGPMPTNVSILKVKPFLASGALRPADIRPALDEMRRIYEGAGITLQILPTVVLKRPAFRIVSSAFTGTITRRLVMRGVTGAANLFFVDDFAGGASEVGIAAGLPGDLAGVRSNRNGVLIGLNAHLVSNLLNPNYLAETAGHEMGHYLGLFHPTEEDGRQFDILNDTPKCPAAERDRDKDGMVSLQECRGLGTTNIMFYMGNGVLRQTRITADQSHVVHYSPIAR